jgi:hypothetical protein
VHGSNEERVTNYCHGLFCPEGQIIQRPTARQMVDQVVTKITVFLLLSSETGNSHYDSLLPVEEKYIFDVFK